MPSLTFGERLQQLRPVPSTTLGERLTQFRAMLTWDSFDAAPWSRARLARAAHLAPAVLARLETAGTGTAANLAALLRFYRDQGFNVGWLFLPDHKGLSPYLSQDNWRAFELADIYENMRALCQVADAAHELPPKSPGAPAELSFEALCASRDHIQAHMHLLLVQQLPPISVVVSSTDLSQYQRLLPPVRATDAGWRSRAVRLQPFHYYEAGASVPFCNNKSAYLTYETGPQEVPAGAQCPHCALLLS